MENMTLRENMQAIFDGKQPEYYGDFRDAMITPADPIRAADAVPRDGKEHRDSWGTVCVWPAGAPGKHPHVTSENAVIKDITRWKEQLVVPEYKKLDWSLAKAQANAVDRGEMFVGFFSAQGLFERSHFLMGMEDALCAYLEEPDAMYEMLTAIAEFKKGAIKQAAYHMRPDVVFFQDDWGSKQSVFLPPSVWREIIKPLQKEIADTIHECGALYMHHADCICEPLVDDMVEIGIDFWQGVIPQNDIVSIQAQTEGKLAMIGGVDVPSIDNEDTPEQAIVQEAKRAIDTYCPAGRFYPCATAPLLHKRNDELLSRSIREYGRQWAAKHPKG